MLDVSAFWKSTILRQVIQSPPKPDVLLTHSQSNCRHSILPLWSFSRYHRPKNATFAAEVHPCYRFTVATFCQACLTKPQPKYRLFTGLLFYRTALSVNEKLQRGRRIFRELPSFFSCAKESEVSFLRWDTKKVPPEWRSAILAQNRKYFHLGKLTLLRAVWRDSAWEMPLLHCEEDRHCGDRVIGPNWFRNEPTRWHRPKRKGRA